MQKLTQKLMTAILYYVLIQTVKGICLMISDLYHVLIDWKNNRKN